MKKFVLTIGVITGIVLGANAQVNLSALPYTQNFSGLGTASGTWADNTTIPGWYAANTNLGTITPYTAYTVGSGGGTSSSTLYALGNSGSSERALGGAPASATYTLLGMRLVNNTGGIFNNISVKYDLEQWSDRGTATVTMSYQKFAPGTGSLTMGTGWTVMSTVISPLPINATPATGLGNGIGLLPNVVGVAGGLNLALGDELWVRWSITKIAGQNATHGIDNVMVVVPEPSTAAFALLGVIGLALRRAKRLA